MIQWGVSGEALQTRRRRGGTVAAEGTRYQRLYAQMRVLSMLEGDTNIAAVRWESSQDVDLFLADGREQYIQVKNEAGAKLTLNALVSILASFALDMIDSNGADLRFLLVANAGTLDDATERLRDGALTDFDLKKTAGIVREEDPILRALTEAELQDLIRKLASRIDFNVPAGHAEGGIHSFESFARNYLINYGVRFDQVKPLINEVYRLVETRGEISREQLLLMVAPSVLKSGKASMEPGVDTRFVNRPKLVEQAALGLFRANHKHVSLFGMGGSGKTQLAAALANDERCGGQFPDGILWCVLGQTPNLPAVINALIVELDGAPVAGDADNCAASLRSMLAKKNCLLVVDDAWTAQDLMHFVPGHGLTRVLATCRDRKVVDGTASEIVDVGMMTESEALELLHSRHTGDTDFDHVGATRFAERVGRLPLALSLGAARANQGSTYSQILEDLEESEASIQALDADFGEVRAEDPETRRQLSLEACFDMSVRRLNPDVRAALLSLALMPEDATVSAAEAAWIPDLSNADTAQRYMALLVRASLVLERGSRPDTSWYLHDLIRDYLRAAYSPSRAGRPPLGASGPLQGAHSDFIDRCGRAGGGRWADVPGISYLDRHLTWHAEMGQRVEVADEVLSQQRDKHPLWLRRLQAKGETALFLADTERSARLGHNLVQRGEQVLDGMRMVARAAVARSCVVSKANKVPPPLAARLVAEGRWPYREAYSIASLAEGLGKVWTLGRIQPYVGGTEREQLEKVIFEELQRTLFVLAENSSLEAVVPHASPAFRKRIFAHASSKSAATHALVLSHLVPYEPSMRHEWLSDFAARTFSSDADEVRAYTTLLENGVAPPPASVSRLMDLFPKVETKVALSLLSCLLPLLPERVQEGVIGVLFAAGDPSNILLPVVQSSLPLGLTALHRLRHHAHSAKDPVTKAWMLGATLHVIAASERSKATDEALSLIRALPNSDWRKAQALMSVDRVVAVEVRADLQSEAWNIAQTAGLGNLGVSNFKSLCKNLTAGAQAHATSILEGESPRTKVFALPSLIAASSGEAADKQVRMLADATRSHGGYGDLTECIDRISSVHLDLLYDACTALRTPGISLSESKNQRRGVSEKDLQATVVRAWREKTRPPSAARMFLADKRRGDGVELSAVECAAVLVSASDLGVPQLANLFEQLAPHLRAHFSEEEISDLEQTIAFTFAVYD